MLKRFVSKSDQKLCQKCKFMVFCLFGCDISRLRDRWHNCSKICNFRQFLAIYKSMDLVIKNFLFTSFKKAKSREGNSIASCYLFLNSKKYLMKFNILIFMFFQFFVLNDMNCQDLYNSFWLISAKVSQGRTSQQLPVNQVYKQTTILPTFSF